MANEKRLISIALWEEFKNEVEKDLEPYDHYDSGYGDAIERVDDWLYCQPKGDAVEVVHGEWIETLVPDGYVQKASRLRKKCSVCGWTNACRYNYCPNCGAKMDGDGNG